MSDLIMVIDKKRCVGCHTCSIACKLENNLPKDVHYTKVYTNAVPKKGETESAMDMPTGTHPTDGGFINSPGNQRMSLDYYTGACQHCEEPACVPVCPTRATYKRDEDGIVVMDYDTCIGCNSCVTACPYSARVAMGSAPAYYPVSQDKPLGGQGIPPHKANTVEKCTFCVHKIDKGELPACVEACPARARFFGLKDNPSNEAFEVLNSGRTVEQLFPEENTKPSVYFVK